MRASVVLLMAVSLVVYTPSIGNASSAPTMPAGITEQSYYPLINGDLTDAGPNGYNGTAGPGVEAPAVSSVGLSFTQSANQYVQIPCAAFAGPGTFIALVQPGDITTDTALPMVWGSDTATGLGFSPSSMGAPSWFSEGAANNLQAIDRPLGTFSLAVSPSTGAMWINGVAVSAYTTDSPSVPACNNAAYIGNASRDGVVFNFPFNGTILSLMKITNASPSSSQLSQVLAYMWYQKEAAGISGPTDANPYDGPVTVYVGDSRAACAGVADIVSAVTANCWTYYSQQAAGLGGTTLVSALGSSVSSSILDFLSLTMPQVDQYTGEKLAVWEGGGIDLVTGSTPSQVLSNIDAAASVAHAHNMKFIATSIAPSIIESDPQRSQLNASLLARARSGAYDGFIGFASMPWENQPQSTQCFLDGFHEVHFCQYQMSAYAKCSLAFTEGAIQCPLPVYIPYLAWSSVDSTTVTISIYDILPGQRVAGVYYLVIDPLAAPGCTAFLTSIGDSNDTTTSYLPTQSYPSSTQATNTTTSFTSNNGTVTATFTSVGCNLNAFTAGQIGIELMLEKQW